MSDPTRPAIKLIDSARFLFLGKEDQFQITHSTVETWPERATVVVDLETLTKAAHMAPGYESAGLALRSGAAIVPLQRRECLSLDLLAGESRRHVAVAFPYDINEWDFMGGVLAAYSCSETHAWNWRMLVGLATAYSSGTTVFHDVLDLLPERLAERKHFSICPACLARFKVELELYIHQQASDKAARASAREELQGEFPGGRGLHIIMSRGLIGDPFATVFEGGDLGGLDDIMSLLMGLRRPGGGGMAFIDLAGFMRSMARRAEQHRQQEPPAAERPEQGEGEK